MAGVSRKNGRKNSPSIEDEASLPGIVAFDPAIHRRLAKAEPVLSFADCV
jgi:hypothetical protein